MITANGMRLHLRDRVHPLDDPSHVGTVRKVHWSGHVDVEWDDYCGTSDDLAPALLVRLPRIANLKEMRKWPPCN